MKVLILGAGGMLGSAIFSVLTGKAELDVWGTLRSDAKRRYFSFRSYDKLLLDVDVEDVPLLHKRIADVKPDVLINCIGVIKQLPASEEALPSISINSLLPHQLADICGKIGARLVHFSTDCVFSGSKGHYLEDDFPDANDLYGRSKFLGELATYPHAVTIRTSIIGHELGHSHSLVDWFLSQKERCSGYNRAFFSGLPSVELARIVGDFVLPDATLSGVYQVASARISKYDLLSLIAKEYSFAIKLVPDASVNVDRSLDGSMFNQATGYVPPDWPALVKQMHIQFQHRNAGNV